MASKASMLKTNAKKASSGLFAGMTPLNKDSEEKKQAVTKAAPVEEKKIAEEVKKPVVEKTPEIKEESSNKEVAKVEEKVIAPVAEPVVEKETATPVEPKEEANVVNDQTVPYYQQNVPQSQPQQVMPEPVSYVQQAPVQQTPVQQFAQIPQPQFQPAQGGYQNPVLTQQSAATKQNKQEKSRYEKDKFLLLDIRNLRDYVEHMAKASNMSATKYIRSLIEQDMNKNWDIYQAHKQLEEALKERR